MKIVGSNFPLVRQTAVEADTAPGAAEIIPRKPTHVVIKLSDLYAEPAAGQPQAQLKPGTLVTVLGEESGWSRVAKDGQALGFVASDSLAAAR
jgi:hypothetical protein